MKNTPQKAIAFLRWFCREDCIDEIEGDLMEFYNRELIDGHRRAKWNVWRRVIRYFRPEFLKLFHQPQKKISVAMYRNYFATAWRNLLNSRLHAALNIVGLSIGISACIVIYTIVSFELSFNRNVPDSDRIFRIYSKFKGTYDGFNAGTAAGLQAMVKNEFTGLENVVNVESFSAKVAVPGHASQQKKSFEEQNNIVFTDAGYFDVVQGFQWTAGDADNAMRRPFQVVLTQDKAAKYFGTNDFASLMGREIHYQDSLVLSVAGIVKPPSYMSDFLFTDFISFSTIEKSFLKNAGLQSGGWQSTNGGSQLMIKLLPGTAAEKIRQQLLVADAKYKAMSPEASFVAEYKLQPLSDIHFNAMLGSFEPSHTANRKTLFILASVGIMLLVIAAINFVNLETAQASMRAKEVGVRKVLGGMRMQLISQFLAQSFLVTAIATVLSVILAEVSLHVFSDYIPIGVSLHLLSFDMVGFLFVVVVIVGALAGFYPAIVMSSYSPVQALKSQAYVKGRSRSVVLRRGLTIFQFAFAQVLIIGTMVMITQINFLINKDLGFNKEAIITFHAPFYESPSKVQSLRNGLAQIAELEQISIVSSTPSSNGTSSNALKYKSPKGDIEMQVFRKGGDENYLSIFGLKIISGRALTAADTSEQVIVNETYLKMLHLTPEEAIGQEVWISKKPRPIVGVVRDFNTVSLREGLQPVFITYEPDYGYTYAVKLQMIGKNGSDVKSAMSKMENAWKKVFPEEPFSAEFFDQTIANFYKTEKATSALTATAMSVAIVICCLGLFGLVSFNAVSRTKEIGVRKALGATVGNIVLLLSKDIVYLVVIAFAIAVPVAYYSAQKFLEDYAFHAPLSWWLFALAGASSILLALATASQQAVCAAMADPVKSLRME